MSDNKENKVVEVVVDSVAESTLKSNVLYVLGAGLVTLGIYLGTKKCYNYLNKKDE
jgi:hypothetical protein